MDITLINKHNKNYLYIGKSELFAVKSETTSVIFDSKTKDGGLIKGTVHSNKTLKSGNKFYIATIFGNPIECATDLKLFNNISRMRERYIILECKLENNSITIINEFRLEDAQPKNFRDISVVHKYKDGSMSGTLWAIHLGQFSPYQNTISSDFQIDSFRIEKSLKVGDKIYMVCDNYENTYGFFIDAIKAKSIINDLINDDSSSKKKY